MQAQIHAIPNTTVAESSLQQDDAEHRLRSVQIFAFGGVGFAGRTSQGEELYDVILSAPADRAIALLIRTYQNGTPAAKAYALTGLHRLNKVQFAALAADARHSGLRVITAKGCILSQNLLTHIADSLEQQGGQANESGKSPAR